ncbi:Methylmalonate-semialdehyde dehydrogenase (acylating) [Bertholletia excelsa]
MDIQGYAGLCDTPQMLPPPPGSFVDREELIEHVGEFAMTQGYVVTIKQSKKDRVVILGCDRGGVYRNRRKPVDETSGENPRKRKTGSRLTNCPFECVGKKDDGLWVLTVKNGSHNHEPLKDISEHPSARRFTETEVMLIKEMTEAGLKPRQILKRLRQSNPELLSTPKHVYNVKAKLRQGNLTVKRFKTLRPRTSTVANSHLPTTSEPSWRQRYPPRVPNLIGGRFVDSQSSASIDVVNPATQQVVSQVPFTTLEEFRAAVFSAKRAFQSWRSTPVTARQRIMFKFQELIRRDIDKLAFNITTEQGKTLKDAYSEVLRGLEVVEHACGMASLQKGEFASNVTNGIDTYSIREPLGVCAGICPCNYPAMIPLWMFPIAVACGNTFILKPSEKDPGASIMLAELAKEAGFPNGVLNIVHGANDIINAICDDDDIKAVSFVGSDSAGRFLYARASASGKCVQSNMGAKNFAIVMPDAHMDATLNVLVAAGFGAGGQRCMAISTVIFVGDSNAWEDRLVEHAKSLKVNAGTESDADLGPVIGKQEKDHICRLIQSGIDSGARLALDGRNILVPGYELGNFVGPTILSDIRDDMECYKEEISGPVLLCMEAESLEEAINIVNRNKYGNGASIFTTSGAAARRFQIEIEAGQVGINAPIAAPLPFYSYTGSKTSFLGDLNFHVAGKSGLQFYTQTKTVTQQWKDFPCSSGISFVNEDSMVNEESLPNEEPLLNEEHLTNEEVEPLVLSTCDESEHIQTV